MFPEIYRTKGTDPRNGKPNVIALMLNEHLGISVEGGSLAAGKVLTFGDIMPFDLEQWEISMNKEGAKK